jgi:hypothetical protein
LGRGLRRLDSKQSRRLSTLVSAGTLVIAAGASIAGCGGSSAIATSTTSTIPTNPSYLPIRPSSTAPLSAPKVSASGEAAYLEDVSEADPALATYANGGGSVALKALLTDGSAFCAFLTRGGGIDDAMVSLAIGARGVEKSTHLPSTVATFNTIEAAALITLCPSEQVLLPAADRTRIRALADALAAGTSG